MIQNSKFRILIKGRVVRGEGYGRRLGFPTANLDRRSYSHRKLELKHGVYAGTAQTPRLNYPAAIVIGPNDQKKLPKLEAYLLGYKGNLYGKLVEITLQKYLRPFLKFKSEAQLIRQIRADIKKVKAIYGQA